jgi:hypothetical protein
MAVTLTNSWYPEYVLDADGGTITLNSEVPQNIFTLTGTAVLTSSWTVTGSNMSRGQRFIIKYQANLTLGVNTLTIFGQNIPQSLAAHGFYVDAIYNGTGWDTDVLVNFADVPVITTDMINNNAVTTALINNGAVTADKLAADSVIESKILNGAVTVNKIASGAVNVDKLAAALKSVVVTIPVSFEAGEQASNAFFPNFDGTINTVFYAVTTDIEATDNAEITVAVNTNPTTPSLVTIPAATAADNSDSLAIASGNTFSAGDELTFTSSKVTDGGKALLTIHMTRR